MKVWLKKSDDFHSIFDTPQLKYMFPALQSLKFDFKFETECTSCGDAYTRMDIDTVLDFDNIFLKDYISIQLAVGRCAKQIIRPWRCYCPGLQYSQITCKIDISYSYPLFTMKF